MFERNVLERDAQRQRRDPAEQRAEDDLQLRAGKLLAHALMPAVTERDMLTGAGAQGSAMNVGVGDRRTELFAEAAVSVTLMITSLDRRKSEP